MTSLHRSSDNLPSDEGRSTINPYAAPSVVASQSSISFDKMPSSPRWFPLLVSASAVAYLGLTLLLITSSHPDDQRSGWWFLFNLPIWMTWVLTQWLLHEEGFWIGALTIMIQSLICAAMLIAGIGDYAIVLIVNAFIIAWVGVLCFLCRWLPRRAFRQTMNAEAR